MMDEENLDRVSKINDEFTMIPELQQAIYRDWGLFYKRMGIWTSAVQHFDDSTAIKEDAYRPLFEKSICMLAEANVEDAEAKAKRCVHFYPNDIASQNQLNNCVYEANRFEESLSRYYNTFHEKEKTRNGLHGIDIVSKTLNKSIGSDAGPFLLTMRGAIDKLQKSQADAKWSDKRPVWKILKSINECDVISVEKLTQPKPIETPIQKCKKKLNERIVFSKYMDNSTAIDIMFLNSLSQNKRLLLEQTEKSNQQILDILNVECGRIDKWKEMLYKRQPIYSKKYVKDNKSKEAFQNVALNRIQFRTRRDSYEQLAKIKRLRNTNFRQMLNVVECVLADFYAIKTKRVFPRKFEFINEICNIVGLAYIERLTIPSQLMIVPLAERMSLLLRIPPEKKMVEDTPKKFGEKSANASHLDTHFLVYKEKVDHFEGRLLHAKYPIEKCYIYHEICNLHVAQRKLDETKQIGKKMVEQSETIGNSVWILHGYLSVIRAELLQGQIKGVAEKLLILEGIQGNYNEFVVQFIKTAKFLTESLLREEALNKK